MRITCPKCHTVQEADEKTAACPNCRAVLRRCADCAQFESRTSVCRYNNRPVPTADIHYPTFNAVSVYCRSYGPANPPPG